MRALPRTLCALACSLTVVAAAPVRDAASQRQALDQLLAAYASGDRAHIRRVFTTSREFQDRLRLREPRELERWLGPWDRTKALLLVELSRVAADVAPQFLATFSRVGREYTATAATQDAGDETAAFLRTWHRASVGMLQGARLATSVIDYLTHFAPALRDGQPPPEAVDARLVLARAIAHERLCWNDRPALDQPSRRIDELTKAAGVKIDADLDGPRRGLREARVKRHAECIRVAAERYDTAAAVADIRAEALIRAGWLLLQAGRTPEALQRLDAAAAGDDPELIYWRGLFRGRALGTMNRHEDAAASYASAVDRFPGAQSAGIGLAFELLRSNRTTEAEERGRTLRAAQAGNPIDPWTSYLDGDRRFVDRWLEELRQAPR
jgi:hypothetical protein